MAHPDQFEEVLNSVLRSQGGGAPSDFNIAGDFDLGVEIALLWVDKLCQHLSDPGEQGTILQSVKSVFTREALLLLLLREDGAEIVFSDLNVSPELAGALCRPGELYHKLASIRFTRFFGNDSPELNALPSIFPEVRKLLAVPVFFNSLPSGCLALASIDDGDFNTTHAMVLSLAASILSLAKTIDELKEKLSVNV